VAYSLIDGKLHEIWRFDTDDHGGRGEGMGNHNLSVGDVDNDGFDEIIAGSLTLDHDGSILYVMDGEMGRYQGSHGDALHVGAFDPDREGLHVFGPHEVDTVASLEYHDGATGETLMAFFAYKDAGRGVAGNITSRPGYEIWGAGGLTVETGGGVYNVQGYVVEESSRDIGLPMNFVTYWDGDLLHELLDGTVIYKYDENTSTVNVMRSFEGVVSNNGTKANPTLQADIFGDWREEVIYRTPDDSELRIYSTTIPTEYRLYTLMHDPVYRMGIAWQNITYNQPPHISFYLGEDIRDQVLLGQLEEEKIDYTPNLDALKHVVILKLSGPVQTQLLNSLNQVEHHLNAGRMKQAIQHMQNFIKHLNNRADKDNVDPQVHAALLKDAQWFIERWSD
jgi:FG-GAP repeat.